MKSRYIWFSGAILLLLHCFYGKAQDLKTEFKTPPSSIHTSVYWYWIEGNITKEGVVRDLEAMKAAGINRAFIGNQGGHGIGDPQGHNIKLFSEEWWDITHTALKKAGELDIEIGIFNSPGWSQAGGPWVKPQEAMRYLGYTQTTVQGPGNISVQLDEPVGETHAETIYRGPEGLVSIQTDKPAGIFQDIKVIAYPAPPEKNILLYQPFHFPNTTEHTVEITTGEKFTARSLTIRALPNPIHTPVELQVLRNGTYETIKQFEISRLNPRITVGYEPWAPVVISLDNIQGNNFRLIFKEPHPDTGIASIELSSLPKIERYKEKILAKMYDGLTPGWGDYLWEKSPEPDDKHLPVQCTDIIDLTGHLSPDGTLNWHAPEGEWIIIRTGMLPTGAVNAPAMPDATGLEIDKLNKRHIETHFYAFIGKILERIPPEDRKTFRVVVQDSYETGGQNFTDDFLESFRERYGYDPLPYLLTYTGTVVESQLQSDRFLWDMRRLVADKAAYEYVGGLREVCHKHGLTTWLENYGHFGFPAEFLQYGGQSDEIGGEFWCVDPLGNTENRLASSCAHIYGKKLVSSETSTSDGPAYQWTPAMLKQRTDRFFTEGINNTLLHLYIQQPDDRAPGLNSWFGTEFDRNNTWFEQIDLYTDYLKRCNYMLQQGWYQADVAYFIGEDTPKMDGIKDPELPRGYQFDFINAEVLIRDAFIKNGRLTLPHGTSYRILVLPKIETMRPEMIRKLEKLIFDGAIVVGPPPTHSPSLENQPQADTEVKIIAQKIWGEVDGIRTKSRKYGKGTIFVGVELEEVMAATGCIKDCEIPENSPLLYSHQSDKGTEIYFLSNQGDGKVTTSVTFRVDGLQPELWLPTTGETRMLPAFIQHNRRTTVPITMEPGESFFIVFDKPGKPTTTLVEANFPTLVLHDTIEGPWQVNFVSKVKQPAPIQFTSLTDLSLHTDEQVRHFSGKAIYTTTFTGIKPTKGEKILLDLNKVEAMAKVKVNGQYCGGVWTYPYTVDITNHIKKGENRLEIEVVNTWFNRLIGDRKLPEEERETNALFNPYQADSQLIPSGLTGPVTIYKTGK